MYKIKMYIEIYTSYYQLRGDIMKIAKVIGLMAAGAGAVLAYQKYSKPVIKKMQEIMDDALSKADEKLDDMI